MPIKSFRRALVWPLGFGGLLFAGHIAQVVLIDKREVTAFAIVSMIASDAIAGLIVGLIFQPADFGFRFRSRSDGEQKKVEALPRQGWDEDSHP